MRFTSASRTIVKYILLAAAVVALGVFGGYRFAGAKLALLAIQERAQEHAEPRQPAPLPERESDQATMAAKIRALLWPRTDSYSIFFCNPSQEQAPFVYLPRAMQSASMIKLFVLAAGMQAVHDGRLSLDERLVINDDNVVDGAGLLSVYDIGQAMPVRRLMELMITESDNTATNVLIDRLGMENIDIYIKAHGYSATQLRHKMMISNQGQRNLSSVQDLGFLLTRLYNHTCVGETEDELMLKILLGQRDTECFPDALPGRLIAHKTGEVTGIYADGGIIYGEREREDFILVIMREYDDDREQTLADMRHLASFFNREAKP